jgi:hypothetical protein
VADVSNGIWNIWEPIKGGIGTGVDAVGNALNAISFIPFVPVVNFQIQEGWKLIAGEGDALTGFAHDMINAGNQWVFDTVDVGILNATVNAAVTAWNSIGGRIGQAAGIAGLGCRAAREPVRDRVHQAQHADRGRHRSHSREEIRGSGSTFGRHIGGQAASRRCAGVDG